MSRLSHTPSFSLLCFLSLSLVSLEACGGSGAVDAGEIDSPTDSPADTSLPDSSAAADFGVDGGARDGALLPRCEDTEPPGTTDLPPVASTLISTVLPTMGAFTVPGSENPASEDGEALYGSMGLGVVMSGPAQARVQLATLGGAAPPATGRRSLAWFVQVSDFQLVDDESPTRLGSLDNPVADGALRAQEAYVAHVISATSRTLARIEATDRPYDFGIVTGDCADSAQSNELDWVIAVMNGEHALETDSGDDDDPLPGPGNDPKDPFDPVPFPAPWLYVAGNHDVELVGVTAPTAADRTRVTGAFAPTGTRDYRRWFGPVARGPVVADDRRALVDRATIAARLAADTTTTPGPAGHGFTATTDTTFGANYVYDAIPGFLRVIALDTSDDTGGSPGLVHRATVDHFFAPALAQAETDHVLVVVASHHATAEIDTLADSAGSPVADAVPPAELESLVAGHANVIAWLVGHRHDNRIRAIAGSDATHPGYWEVMTTAIADWPSQARFLEIVDNGNGTLSLFGTLVDYDTSDCMERRFRRLAAMEWQSGWRPDVSHRLEDQNVELVWPTPAGLAATIGAATGHARIESQTTLAL